MPFVNPKSSEFSTDVRKIFIGRTNELDFFVEQILQPDNPTHNIISVSGNGGVGKSALLAQFIAKANATEFKDYCLIALVNERQTTPVSIMEKFTEQLGLSGYPLVDFERELRNYKETLRHLQANPEAFSHDKPNNIQRVPLFSRISIEEAKIRNNNVLNEYHYHQSYKDTLNDAVDQLTRTFVRELNYIANTPIALNSQKKMHQRRIILFFDPFEQLANEAVPWLLDYFLETNVSTNIILVMAGRDSIERSNIGYLRQWLPYHDNGTIHSILLKSFSEEETRRYLSIHGITEPDRVTTLWKLSRGLPLYLSLLTSNPYGEIDPTKDVVATFLRGIKEQEKVKQQLALDAALFSKPFNQDDLEAFTYITDDDRPMLYRWLTSQSFVQSNPQDGRHSYHDLARDLFCRHLYQSPKACHTTRKALAEHYKRLLDKTLTKKDQGKQYSTEQLELVPALVSQLLLLPDETNHLKAIEQILRAYEHCDKEQSRDLIRVLRELGQNQPNNQASTHACQVAKNLLYYIQTNSSRSMNQEFLAPASFLLEKVIDQTSFPSEVLATIYYNRANTYYLLRKPQQAIADLNDAITANDKYLKAYILRGQIYSKSSPEDALANFIYALEFDPNNAAALLGRGQTYYQMERYEEALQDLNFTLEMNPNNEHGIQKTRGEILYKLERYKEAIDAFTRSVMTNPACSIGWEWLARTYQKLDPTSEIPRLLLQIPAVRTNYISVIANRAKGMVTTNHYEEAISEFTRALELNPKDVGTLIIRGEVYNKLERYREALEDFACAVKVKPNDASIITKRGNVYFRLKNYQEALVDFTRALKLSSKNADALFGRGQTYRHLGHHKEALCDLECAIELEPKYEHRGHEQRGLAFYALKKYQEAVDAFIKALVAQPECSQSWKSLADAYAAYLPHSEIPKVLRKVPISNPENADTASAIAYRAQAIAAAGDHNEALIDLAYALNLDPDNARVLLGRGQTYRHLGHYEDALHDLERAIELEPEYEHEGYKEIGLTLHALEKYQEAVDAFIKALVVEPNCSQCWKSLADAYTAYLPHSEIPKVLREVPISSPENADTASAIAYRAQAIAAAGDHNEALIDLAYVLDFDPDNTKALLSRGKTYRHLGHYKDALHDLERAIELEPEYEHESYKEIGLTLHALEKYQEAADAFIKALVVEPNCSQCWKSLADAYTAYLPHSEIPKMLREVPVSNPENADTASVITYRAQAIMRIEENYEEALKDFDYAITLDKTIIVNLISQDRGLLLSHLGRYAEAIESYKQELKQDPNHYTSLYNLAVAIARWKGYSHAKSSINKARDALNALMHTQKHGVAFYGLGGLEALAGNIDQALNYLQQALPLEEQAMKWACHDVAWLDLRRNSRFQKLIRQSPTSGELASSKERLEDLNQISEIHLTTAQLLVIDSTLVPSEPESTSWSSIAQISPDDLGQLAHIVGQLPNLADEGERSWRLLLQTAGLSTFIGSLHLTGAPQTVAWDLINQLKNYRPLTEKPDYQVLGLLLCHILTLGELPQEHNDFIKCTIRKYSLMPPDYQL